MPGILFAILLAAVDPLVNAQVVASIVVPAGGKVGFAAIDVNSGRAAGLRQHERFPMQSVFKLPIAIETLRQVDGGKLALDRAVTLVAADDRPGMAHALAVPGKATVRELLDAMLVHSDNAACDKLLALIGGPRAVDARMRALGVSGMTIRLTEQQMAASKADNTTTPTAMITLLAKLARGRLGLSAASAAYLDDVLLRVATGPRRLKAGLPDGTPLAHKTGTSGTRDGTTDATNDVGVITMPDGRRIAIAVFVHASPADEATREATIAGLARAAYDAMAAPRAAAH